MEQNQDFLVFGAIALVIYIAFILMVLNYGRKRNIGLGWTIVFSIFLSPLIALIIAFASGKKRKV